MILLSAPLIRTVRPIAVDGLTVCYVCSFVNELLT
jgi:hypothetical protein